MRRVVRAARATPAMALLACAGAAVPSLAAQTAPDAGRYGRVSAGLSYYVESNLRGVAMSAGLAHRVGAIVLAGVAELAIGPDRTRRYRRNTLAARCFDYDEAEYASDLKCLDFQPGFVLEALAPVTRRGPELHASWRVGSLHGPAVGITVPVTRRPGVPVLLRAELGRHHWLVGGLMRFGAGRSTS